MFVQINMKGRDFDKKRDNYIYPWIRTCRPTNNSILEKYIYLKNHLTSLTPPLFTEVSVPRQEIERSYIICVRGIDFAAVSMIFPLGFGTVPTKKYDIFCLPFYWLSALFIEYHWCIDDKTWRETSIIWTTYLT